MLNDFASILNEVKFEKLQPTVIFAHGFLESLESSSVQTIVDSYLFRGGWNVIVIDWSVFARGSYLTVLPQLKNVGLSIGEYLTKFIQAGYPSEKIHLVGHSLGAQLVGLVARNVKARTQVQIRRVTGLDPADPGFDPILPGSFQPLSASDG